jgi:hypothetical protein
LVKNSTRRHNESENIYIPNKVIPDKDFNIRVRNIAMEADDKVLEKWIHGFENEQV